MKQLKLLFTVLFLAVLGLGNVWGEEVTVTSTFTSNKWAVGTDEPAWTATGASATALESSGSARGVQTTLTNIKSSGLTLSNSTIKNLGKISKIVITCSANGTGGSISSVKVGSTALTCDGEESYTVGNSAGQTPVFEMGTPATGDISIAFASTATSKSLYVKSIAVTYITGGSENPTV